MESIRGPDFKRAIYGDHPGPQLAKNSRDRVVAATAGFDSLRFVSSLSQHAFRCLAVSGLSGTMKDRSAHFELPTFDVARRHLTRSAPGGILESSFRLDNTQAITRKTI